MPVINARKLRLEITTDTDTRVINLTAAGDQPMRLVLDETVITTSAQDGTDRISLQLVALGVKGTTKP